MKKIFFLTLLSITLGYSQVTTLERLRELNENPDINIILMIGDGMGLTQISAGTYFNDNSSALEKFDVIGLSKTQSANSLVTDSAASGTAMACGKKTYNGAVGVSMARQPLESILEICKSRDYITGLIATSSIVHATPASFYAKVESRREYQEIALQLSEHEVDYFVGGGEKHFNKRDDKRNLIDEMEEKSYEIVTSFSKFQKSESNKLGYFTYNDEPPRALDLRKPSLEDVLSSTLEKIEARQNPFFIMVEGSQIDWGGHGNDTDYIVSEFKDFNGAVDVAFEFAKKNQNTLVIVTADHETGGMAINKGNIKTLRFEASYTTLGHTATMVPVFSYGPFSEKFSGIYENTSIFEKMLESIERQ
ncbi:MAG: alkaline phosphatase [Bacteroidota bacterium]|nr:alkaline phosphatase [Bacteroidota bacterium]